MSRVWLLVLFITIALGIQPLFAHPQHEPLILAQAFPPGPSTPAAPTDDSEEILDQEIPESIGNNQYIQESRRLANLAYETYQYGDYDLSASLSLEAIRYAELSDEYIALQLKIMAANEAIAVAKSSLDWASSSGASGQHPSEYGEAETWYNQSLSFRTAEDWDEAYNAARRAIDILAYIGGVVPDTGRTGPLPATYTVRAWATYRDCFWNIAARPWVYGDGHRWRTLYEANRSKLPQPGNPNLIEPGMVITIPSIRGETRRGAWDPATTYRPLN
jgi:hypothetical protein